MRISYRAHGGSHDYWQRRWDGVAVDSGAINRDRYPGLYAERVVAAHRPRAGGGMRCRPGAALLS